MRRKIECDKCLGIGFYKFIWSKRSYITVCEKCDGNGKLDWLEAVVGTRIHKHIGVAELIITRFNKFYNKRWRVWTLYQNFRIRNMMYYFLISQAKYTEDRSKRDNPDDKRVRSLNTGKYAP